MNTTQFKDRLHELGIDLNEFSHLTGINRRTLKSYWNGERRIPTYMPFLLKCIPLYIKVFGK